MISKFALKAALKFADTHVTTAASKYYQS